MVVEQFDLAVRRKRLRVEQGLDDKAEYEGLGAGGDARRVAGDSSPRSCAAATASRSRSRPRAYFPA